MALSAKNEPGVLWHIFMHSLGDGDSGRTGLGSSMFAGHRKLDNLTVIVDNNGLQLMETLKNVCSPYPIDKKKFEALNFHVDGNDFDQLKAPFDEAKATKGIPTSHYHENSKRKRRILYGE